MTSGPWLPLALLVVPSVAALMVVVVGLLQLVFGRREVVQLPRAMAVAAPAPRVARGTAPPANRPAPAIVPVIAPQFMRPAAAPVARAAIERAPTVRAQPVRPSRPAFDEDEPTAFYARPFAAR